MNEWLEVDRLNFRYGSRSVLSDLSFAVDADCRILAVIGRSGTGKSTLLALLAGHLTPRSGSISVAGHPVRAPDARRPMVFQDDNLFPWMSVLDNVGFGLKCRGMARGERETRAMEMLRRMGLDETAGAFPNAISGGMRQRVGLARAFVLEPECVLLDEPFRALDEVTRAQVREQLHVCMLAGTTRAVLVTHDLAEAALLGDSALVLRSDCTAQLLRWRSGDERDAVTLDVRQKQLSALLWNGATPFPDPASR